VTSVSRCRLVAAPDPAVGPERRRVRPRRGTKSPPIAAVASALLFLPAGLTGCFNPTHIGEATAKENHVPVVEALPPPTFEPLPAPVGRDCLPLKLQLVGIDDADGDTLTVRFDLVVERDERASRVLLRESPPIPPLADDTYPLTDLTSLVLGQDVLGAKLGDLEAQKGRTQLVELRVSDNFFVSDENGDPIPDDGGSVVFLSWLVALQDCAPVTP